MSVQTSTFDQDSKTESATEVASYLAEYVRNRRLPPNLRDAVQYALLGGGKRLRPILVLCACEAVGGCSDQAMPAAGAIELIHNFSLVHDDLPAMDDDDLRRGRPTLHRYTSDAMAILAGDVMMAMAFELVATRVTPRSLSGAIAKELATATSDMIAGQVYDTLPEFDGSVDSREQLAIVHRHKTGALIRCSCRMGAMIGGARQDQLDQITDYAEAIGLMFQVVDDLLDVTQTTEHLGKGAGKDADQGKLTYPGLLGIDASRDEVQRLCEQALDAVQALGTDAAPLRELCEYMAVRTK